MKKIILNSLFLSLILAGTPSALAKKGKQSEVIAEVMRPHNPPLPPQASRGVISFWVNPEDFSIWQFNPYTNNNLRNTLPEDTSNPQNVAFFAVDPNLGEFCGQLFPDQEDGQEQLVTVPVPTDTQVHIFYTSSNMALYHGRHSIQPGFICSRGNTEYEDWVDMAYFRGLSKKPTELFFQRDGIDSKIKIRLEHQRTNEDIDDAQKPRIPHDHPDSWSYFVPLSEDRNPILFLERDGSLARYDATQPQNPENLSNKESLSKRSQILIQNILPSDDTPEKIIPVTVPTGSRLEIMLWPNQVTYQGDPIELEFLSHPASDKIGLFSAFSSTIGRVFTLENGAGPLSFRAGNKKSPFIIEVNFMGEEESEATPNHSQPPYAGEGHDPGSPHSPAHSSKDREESPDSPGQFLMTQIPGSQIPAHKEEASFQTPVKVSAGKPASLSSVIKETIPKDGTTPEDDSQKLDSMLNKPLAALNSLESKFYTDVALGFMQKIGDSVQKLGTLVQNSFTEKTMLDKKQPLPPSSSPEETIEGLYEKITIELSQISGTLKKVAPAPKKPSHSEDDGDAK